jgi:hypothetical protein
MHSEYANDQKIYIKDVKYIYDWSLEVVVYLPRR